MPLPSDLIRELEDMPRQLELALRLVPHDRLPWRPESWGGCPSETFSALEQVCHLRDIERDGVHYLRSHDQQHLAGIQWLAGKIASEIATR